MSNLRDYHGHCHCGSNRFTARVPQIRDVIVCKCSYCLKSGIVWKFPLPSDSITLHSDKTGFSIYEFGAKIYEHNFCSKCGSSILIRKKESKEIGINVRLLKDVDWESLDITVNPGTRSLPVYEPPTFPSVSALGELDPGQSFYHSNCHCKAVKLTVKTKSLEDQEVLKCNCSLCSRNGDLFIYPPASRVALEGDENLTDYAFLDKKSLHSFCKTCGVSVLVRVLHENQDLMALNVRAFNGIDLDTLKYKLYDGAKNKPVYDGKQHDVK